MKLQKKENSKPSIPPIKVAPLKHFVLSIFFHKLRVFLMKLMGYEDFIALIREVLIILHHWAFSSALKETIHRKFMVFTWKEKKFFKFLLVVFNTQQSFWIVNT